MTKLVKLLRNLKKLKKYKKFSKYFQYSPWKIFTSNQVSIKTVKKSNFLGNFEFALFCLSVGLGLWFISRNNKHYSETTRLVSAGIATHIVVDVITYLGDKINTKVKVDSFMKKKSASTLKDVDYFFENKFSHFKVTKKRTKILKQSLLGVNLNDLHFRGLQAAMVFVTINSIVFYGLYKNLKYFFKEKFGMDGFTNFFFSAGVAQFFAMILAFPLENIKTRMQASNFSYDSFFMYYRKLIKGKPWSTIHANFKNEYSGFVSHLVLYVVYESVTFAIYESLMKIKKVDVNDYNSNHNNYNINDNNLPPTPTSHHEINFTQVIFASMLSGLVAAVVTNPIDVYQINKQVNPKFAIGQLNRENIMLGMKERIIFITFLNVCTFIFLENIGPKLYNVRLE